MCIRDRRIPSIPASKKLSKIEILRLAICYMSYLRFVASEEQCFDLITAPNASPDLDQHQQQQKPLYPQHPQKQQQKQVEKGSSPISGNYLFLF